MISTSVPCEAACSQFENGELLVEPLISTNVLCICRRHWSAAWTWDSTAQGTCTMSGAECRMDDQARCWHLVPSPRCRVPTANPTASSCITALLIYAPIDVLRRVPARRLPRPICARAHVRGMHWWHINLVLGVTRRVPAPWLPRPATVRAPRLTCVLIRGH